MYRDNDSPGATLFLMCVFAFLALITCTGCGSAPDGLSKSQPREWDDRLRPYIADFAYEMGTVRDAYSPERHDWPRVVSFELLPDGIIGLCFYSDAFGEVYIDISLADPDAPPAVLRAVVAHELAHCVLRARHDDRPDELLSPKIPADLDKWTPERWVTAWDRLGEVAP